MQTLIELVERVLAQYDRNAQRSQIRMNIRFIRKQRAMAAKA